MQNFYILWTLPWLICLNAESNESGNVEDVNMNMSALDILSANIHNKDNENTNYDDGRIKH